MSHSYGLIDVPKYVGMYVCQVIHPYSGLRRDTQVLPDTKVAQTLGGALSSMFSLFAGFLISPAKVPDGWLFAYYLSPLHYVVEVSLLLYVAVIG